MIHTISIRLGLYLKIMYENLKKIKKQKKTPHFPCFESYNCITNGKGEYSPLNLMPRL